MKIEWIRYMDQFSLGISFAAHAHGDRWHFHVFIDLGPGCVEITVGER